MGTDIHGVFQKWDGKRWVDIPSKYQGHRHYQLFAVLANVRNGFGFAGISTGEAVEPIDGPRGLPEDVDDDDGRFGDHSFSWLSGEEMIEWFEHAPTKKRVGILDRKVYESWDKKTEPASYCADITGRDIVIVNDNPEEMGAHPEWTNVRCIWDVDLCQELAYFFDEVQRLVEEHGKVRFVFGFDS